MKVVIDTNVLLMSLAKNSKYRPIFDSLLESKIELVISNEILQEYIEIIARKTTPKIAQNLADLLLRMKNVKKIDVYFRWNLIHRDTDDNKFVDCAVVAGVKYIVTNDKHFKILKQIKFPPVDIISADNFLKEVVRL